LWKKAPPPQTKKESPSVQKTPAHRTGERAVWKERNCKGKENRSRGCAKKKLVLAAVLVTSRKPPTKGNLPSLAKAVSNSGGGHLKDSFQTPTPSKKRQPLKEFRPLRRATRR
jgi:hypothetical protein